MDSQQRKFLERRKGPDILVKLINWFAGLSWIIMLSILMIIWKAKPQVENFFDKLLKVRLRHTWDYDLMQYSLYLMVFLLIICIIGLIIYSRRNRRKTDKPSYSLIFMSLLSVIGLVIYYINFN